MSTQLRDRFFALSNGETPAEEVAEFLAEVEATEAEPAAALDGLALHWHPTARFKAVRFVGAEDLGADVRDLFARPSRKAPHVAAVFADPHELSFRNFENILPLDRLFTRPQPESEAGESGPEPGAGFDLELADPREFAPGAYTFALHLPGTDRRRLEDLDALDLYTTPLNAASRGGDRFIFHSALLADALTRAVAESMPQPLLDGFSHVNPVFRCNRFEPGDANFHLHRDTPYYDSSRNHISRYTVLIYLTGGTGEPVLDLAGGGALTGIDPFTCVVFNQHYQHEGAPYLEGRKVFLRTELVFTEPDLDHDPGIGALFNKACYLTGESVFAPELARHADTYYDRVAAAHWDGLAPGTGREPFVHKNFRGTRFVANGYDFWFAKRDGLTPAACAALTLLDYFNCKIGADSFRSLCETEVIEADDTAWIPAFLNGEGDEAAVAPFDKSMLFPEPEEPITDEVPQCACGLCGEVGPGFPVTRSADVIEHYTRAQDAAKAEVLPAPIVMMGEDVLLDPDRFVVDGDRIHVLGKESPSPVNFASCMGGPPVSYPEEFISTAVTIDAAHFLVPPILFTESDDCYHLRFDFFGNTWTLKHEQTTAAVPMIRPFTMEDIDEDWDDEDEDEREEVGETVKS